MLVPLLNKQTTANEFSMLCWLLGELKSRTTDYNIKWKLVEINENAGQLYQEFLNENDMTPVQPDQNRIKYFEETLAGDINLTEQLLSYSFHTIGGIDAAHFDGFNILEDFKKKISAVTKKILNLLHEYR
jgi:hypothetical protein